MNLSLEAPHKHFNKFYLLPNPGVDTGFCASARCARVGTGRGTGLSASVAASPELQPAASPSSSCPRSCPEKGR